MARFGTLLHWHILNGDFRFPCRGMFFLPGFPWQLRMQQSGQMLACLKLLLLAHAVGDGAYIATSKFFFVSVCL